PFSRVPRARGAFPAGDRPRARGTVLSAPRTLRHAPRDAAGRLRRRRAAAAASGAAATARRPLRSIRGTGRATTQVLPHRCGSAALGARAGAASRSSGGHHLGRWASSGPGRAHPSRDETYPRSDTQSGVIGRITTGGGQAGGGKRAARGRRAGGGKEGG